MISAIALGFEVKGGSGPEKWVICPFHDDHKASASYNEDKGLFYCAVCKLGMNVEQVARRLGVPVDAEDITLIDPSRRFSLELTKSAEKIERGGRLSTVQLEYIKDRGIGSTFARRYFSGVDAPHSGVMITCKDQKHEVISTVTRILPPYDEAAKYIVHGPKPMLWPFEEFAYEYGTLIFVEGIFSRIRLAQIAEIKYGDVDQEDAVDIFSLLGARIPKDLSIILDQTAYENLVFLFDNDMSGLQAADQAMAQFPTATVHCVNHEIDNLSDHLLIRLLKRYVE